MSAHADGVASLRGDAAVFVNHQSSPNRKFTDSTSYLRYRKAQVLALSVSNTKTVQPFSTITELQKYAANTQCYRNT